MKEGLLDADYAERYTLGFGRLRERLSVYPPERVAQTLPRCSMPTSVRIADGPIFVGPRQLGGAMAFRAIACLPASTGAWRERGGGMLHMTFGLYGEALNSKGYEMPERWIRRSVR